jgi:hypothetical protein
MFEVCWYVRSMLVCSKYAGMDTQFYMFRSVEDYHHDYSPPTILQILAIVTLHMYVHSIIYISYNT